MKRERFENWLKNIYETRDEEISCTECFDLVSRFVELDALGQEVIAEMHPVEQHLSQCPACQTEYNALRDLRLLEEEGDFPPLDDLRNLIQ
jgi:hypothetical protein